MIQPGSIIGHVERPERMVVIVAASEHSRWTTIARSYKAHMLGTGMVEDKLFWHGFMWDDALVIVRP